MSTNKHTVRVFLRAEYEVEIVVECEDGDSPVDLTPEEEQTAIKQAPRGVQWEIHRVQEMKP